MLCFCSSHVCLYHGILVRPPTNNRQQTLENGQNKSEFSHYILTYIVPDEDTDVGNSGEVQRCS